MLRTSGIMSLPPQGDVMQSSHTASGSPAAERAIAGLCHDLNNRLASVSAYLFVLKRRGLLGNGSEAVEADMASIAQDVRHVRSLCRGGTWEVGPVGLTVIAEQVSEIMAHYPEGPVHLEVAKESLESGAVIRGDWTQIMRSVLQSVAWLRRGVPSDTAVPVTVSGSSENALTLEALDRSEAAPEESLCADCEQGVEIVVVHDRAVRISYTDPVVD